MTDYKKIMVMGAGSWGTALALKAQQAGHDVEMWTRRETLAEALTSGGGNPEYLPGMALPPIPATTELARLKTADIVFAVIPVQHSRAYFKRAAAFIKAGTPVLLCAKGIEQGSLKWMTQILAETIPHSIPIILSGPSFAKDVAQNLPTAITLACEDERLGHDLVAALGQPRFRPYWSPDMIGAQIGGAVKNVLAIACGISEGLGLGKSAHAALLTRGFAEMRRLAKPLGAQMETFSGLSGFGDLVLTCSSPQSRNMSFGLALGQGQSAADILTSRASVTEGVTTTPALLSLARKYDLDLPICERVGHILTGAQSVDETIHSLLARPFKGEFL
mgnify:CR=1 FL=1